MDNLGRGEAPAPTKGRGGLIQDREADEKPTPTQRGREDLILTQEGYMIPPPPGRAEKRTEERKRKASRTDQKNRHDEPTRVGNYAC